MGEITHNKTTATMLSHALSAALKDQLQNVKQAPKLAPVDQDDRKFVSGYSSAPSETDKAIIQMLEVHDPF